MKNEYKQIFERQMKMRTLKLQWLLDKIQALETNSYQHRWESEEETDAQYQALKELIVERYQYLKNQGYLDAAIADKRISEFQ